MPNIATTLKEEIARVARKELRGETETLKKSSSQYRSDIAALKRKVHVLERTVAKMSKLSIKQAAPAEESSSKEVKHRFSAKRLAAQRARLGLSAAELARLLNVSALSVYKWEGGKARPRQSYLPAISHLRTLSKASAAEVLKTIK